MNGDMFKSWVEMTDPLVSYIGVESGNLVSHKRFLAFFAGGMLPLISLSFLHMLVKFEEQDKKTLQPDVDIDEISKEVAKKEFERDENERLKASQEEIERLQKLLDEMNRKKFENLSEEQNNINRLSYTGRNG
jgi:uncharacterized protein YlxW (UPF0749 family)